MAIDFLERCEVIEECYEFLLGYAAQGLPTDEGSATGREVRDHLEQAGDALIGLSESCRRAIADQQFEPAEKYDAFCYMLERDVSDSLVAVELVLAQPSINSQIIDSLNASIHIRALLTDLFLIDEVLKAHSSLNS